MTGGDAKPAAALLTVRNLPAWMRDNDYIRTGYRPPQPSASATLRSALLSLHNESANIYTHLLGALLFLHAFLPHTPRLAAHPPPHPAAAAAYEALRASGLAALPAGGAAPAAAVAALRGEAARTLAPLAVAAVYCLATSALYHAAWVRSARALLVLSRADFCGIALLCAGHAMSGVRALFYCDPRRGEWLSAVRVYSAVAAAAAVVTARCVLAPGFGGKRAHLARSAAFSLLGGVCLAPVVHAGAAHGWADEEFLGMARCVALSMACYAAAVGFYASRLPECCRPGKHDLWCSSHQFMHCLVVAGAWVHFSGIRDALDRRLQVGCAVSALVRP